MAKYSEKLNTSISTFVEDNLFSEKIISILIKM